MNKVKIMLAGLLLGLLFSAQGALAADQDNYPLWAKDLAANYIPEQKRNPAWAEAIIIPHADNFYRVAPGLYRSAQPSAAAFREYEKLGIKSVINLRANHSDRKLIAGTGLNLIEVPINTWNIKDPEVISVLRHIQNAPGPVLVHCQHGADRTGTIMAMYRLVFENASKAEALDELMNGGYGYHKIWKNIPKYIRNVDVNKIKTAL